MANGDKVRGPASSAARGIGHHCEVYLLLDGQAGDVTGPWVEVGPNDSVTMIVDGADVDDVVKIDGGISKDDSDPDAARTAELTSINSDGQKFSPSERYTHYRARKTGGGTDAVTVTMAVFYRR